MNERPPVSNRGCYRGSWPSLGIDWLVVLNLTGRGSMLYWIDENLR
jgi:hypothetical protein